MTRSYLLFPREIPTNESAAPFWIVPTDAWGGVEQNPQASLTVANPDGGILVDSLTMQWDADERVCYCSLDTTSPQAWVVGDGYRATVDFASLPTVTRGFRVSRKTWTPNVSGDDLADMDPSFDAHDPDGWTRKKVLSTSEIELRLRLEQDGIWPGSVYDQVWLDRLLLSLAQSRMYFSMSHGNDDLLDKFVAAHDRYEQELERFLANVRVDDEDGAGIGEHETTLSTARLTP